MEIDMMPNPDRCPKNVVDSLRRYVVDRIPTGGFLQAVLENNLMEAVGRADHVNIQCLPDICCYVYNEIPDSCWGSPEAVTAWLEKK